MKNPLLVPGLRKLIESGNSEELKNFRQTGHPVVVAELISPLTPSEAWEVLRQVEQPLRSGIFSNLDNLIRVDLITTLRRNDVAGLLADMPPDFFKCGANETRGCAENKDGNEIEALCQLLSRQEAA